MKIFRVPLSRSGMTKDTIWVSGIVGAVNDTESGKGMVWFDPDSDYVDSSGALQGDLDGVFAPQNQNIIVDLSDLCSQIVGRQCPMTANYRVTGMKVSLRNVDDTLDNDDGAVFQGVVGWRRPTSHLIDAVQAHRATLREATADGIDHQLGLMHNADSYSGFRFGLLNSASATNQIRFATQIDEIDGYQALSLSGSQYANLVDMLDIWNKTIDGDSEKGNSLWDSRVLTRYSTMPFSAAISNQETETISASGVQMTPHVNDFEWQASAGRCIEALGGLLLFQFTHSHTSDEIVKDEYHVQIGIEVEGWTEW